MLDWKKVLKSEFDSEEDSFLMLLNDVGWDKAAFRRLIDAMQKCAEWHEVEKKETVELWIAQGFWHCSFWVEEWTTHENFWQEHEPEYYERAYQRLKDLAFWLFMGQSPHSKGLPKFKD